MIAHFALLLLFQLVGEVARNLAGLPLPGPVIGMALFVLAMVALPRLAEAVRGTVQGFLAHLSLLFVPAGVGVVGHLDALGSDGLGILAAVIGSTVAAIAVGALVFAMLVRSAEGEDA